MWFAGCRLTGAELDGKELEDVHTEVVKLQHLRCAHVCSWGLQRCPHLFRMSGGVAQAADMRFLVCLRECGCGQPYLSRALLCPSCTIQVGSFFACVQGQSIPALCQLREGMIVSVVHLQRINHVRCVEPIHTQLLG